MIKIDLFTGKIIPFEKGPLVDLGKHEVSLIKDLGEISLATLVIIKEEDSVPVVDPVISGIVATSLNVGVGGVTVTFSNGGGTTVTGVDGSYSKTLPSGWSGTITVSLDACWEFTPASKTLSNVTVDQTGQNFVAEQIPHTISGYVLEEDNTPVQGVTLTFSEGEGTTTTGADGFYSKEVPCGWSGTVTPSYDSGWTFSEAHSYTNVTSDQIDKNFVATDPPVVKTFKVDFGQTIYTTPVQGTSPNTIYWNNVNGASNDTFSENAETAYLKDVTETTSNLKVKFVEAWKVDSGAWADAKSPTCISPKTATKDSFGWPTVSNKAAGTYSVLKITGCNDAATYDIDILSSRWATVGVWFTATWKIDGVEKTTISSYDNAITDGTNQQPMKWTGVTSTNGEITIQIVNPGTAKYHYINVLQIVETS